MHFLFCSYVYFFAQVCLHLFFVRLFCIYIHVLVFECVLLFLAPRIGVCLQGSYVYPCVHVFVRAHIEQRACRSPFRDSPAL